MVPIRVRWRTSFEGYNSTKTGIAVAYSDGKLLINPDPYDLSSLIEKKVHEVKFVGYVNNLRDLEK